VETQHSISTRVLLWIAQIVLALLAAALILCMWLPIDGVRAWVVAHGPHF
jgi:hypothetical protein